jgi:hypothetical protein
VLHLPAAPHWVSSVPSKAPPPNGLQDVPSSAPSTHPRTPANLAMTVIVLQALG